MQGIWHRPGGGEGDVAPAPSANVVLPLADYRIAVFEEIDAYWKATGQVPGYAEIREIADSAIHLAQSKKGGPFHSDGSPLSEEELAKWLNEKLTYKSNAPHSTELRTGKTREPADARIVYEKNAVRVDDKTWIGRSPTGTFYKFQYDNAGTAHFQRIISLHEIRQIWPKWEKLIIKHAPPLIRRGGRDP